MRNKPFSLFLFVLFYILFIHHVSGQSANSTLNEHEQCGTQHWLESQFSANPALKQKYNLLEQKMGSAVAGKLNRADARLTGSELLKSLTNNTIYTIPIVFHIVSTNPATITNAQIYALLDTLNKDYSGTNADSAGILPYFQLRFGKSNIRFCLAQRNPSGLVTNGIMRYTSSVVSNGGSGIADPIKATGSGGINVWDPTRYLNVWIGSFSSSTLLGYSTFPISSPEDNGTGLSQQGIVIEKGTVPGGATTNYNNGRTLTHEIGHYFWLRHIWGDFYCGDDFPNTPALDDTPIQFGPSSGCSTGLISSDCSAEPRMYQNYMDYSYSNCTKMFSNGQVTRMSICLDSFRAALKISNGCQPVICPIFTVAITNTDPNSIGIVASGGRSPYTYSLDSITFQTSNQFTTLTTGTTYTLYIRDALLCITKVNFTANYIVVSNPSSPSYCLGQPLAISYTKAGNFLQGNVFTAQLSNAGGTFTNPVDIGTVTDTGSGVINAIIPGTIIPGNKYRIRVIASNPGVVSNSYSAEFEIADATVAPAVSISVTTGNSHQCAGSSITFKAKPTNGGPNPGFQWKRNGADVDTGKTFTTTALLNNDIITCTMVSNSACASANAVTSNAIRMLVTAVATPSVIIAANTANTICSGTSVIVTAIPVNGGTAPTFQWRKNGTNTGATGYTYTISDLLNSDTITCVMTGNAACTASGTVVSNSLVFTVANPAIPSLSINSTPGNTVCAGTPVTFTAFTNDSTFIPVLQWKKNGVTVATGAAYTVANPQTNDSIQCSFAINTPCTNAAIIYSNIIALTTTSVTAPVVSGDTTINCGQSITLKATVTTPGNIINWYRQASGGLPFATGDSIVVFPDSTATYYAQAGTAIGTGNIVFSIINKPPVSVQHSQITYYSKGGLALSGNYIYCAGGRSGRFNKDLTTGTPLISRKGFFSDLANGDLWQLGNNSTNGLSIENGAATKLYKLDSNLVATGAFITLSQPVICDALSFVASGEGFVIVKALNTFSRVNLANGNVITMTLPSTFIFNYNEGASYGWAEYNGTDYYIGYASNGATISKINLTTGIVSHLLTLNNALGVLDAALYDSRTKRVYYHFGSCNCSNTNEVTGYFTATASQLNPVCASSRLPITVIVNQIPVTPSVSIVCNSTGTICKGSQVTFTAIPVNGGSAPAFVWTRYLKVGPSGYTYTSTGSTYTLTTLNNNDTVSCKMTSNVPCATTTTANSNIIIGSVITPAPSPSVTIVSSHSGAVCPGINVIFTARVLNAGTTPVYQWQHNGINVGTNDSVYVDTSLNGGTFNCIISTNVNCPMKLPGNPISIMRLVPIPPVVSITSSAGSSVCTGSSVTLTANAINGGTSPVYNWKKNGVSIATGSVYTTSNIVTGDTITCVLKNTSDCTYPATVASKPIIFNVNTIPILNQIADRTVCPGCVVDAIQLNGTGTLYRWAINKNIGLAESGTGNIPAFIASNTTNAPIVATISARPYTSGGANIYICSSEESAVSILSSPNNAITSKIPVSGYPTGIASSFDGSKLYVAHGNVSIVNTATNQVTSTLNAYGYAKYVCASPSGQWLYVSTMYNTVYVYNISVFSYNPTSIFNIGSSCKGLVISPDGSKLYVASSNSLYVLNSFSGTILNTITFAGEPNGVAINKDGSKIFVSCLGSNQVSIVNTIINAAMDSIPVGGSPAGISLSPNESRLYVANNLSNTVSVIDIITKRVIATIPVGNAPTGISITPDASLAYVTCKNSNNIAVINTSTNSVTETLNGFTSPASFGNFSSSRLGCPGTLSTFTITVNAPDYNTWVGTVNTDWYNTGNWLCGRVPTVNDNVTIGLSASNYYPVILSEDTITIKSINVVPGASIAVGSNTSLILTGR